MELRIIFFFVFILLANTAFSSDLESLGDLEWVRNLTVGPSILNT